MKGRVIVMLFGLAFLFTLPGIIASRVLLNETDRPIARAIMGVIQRLAVGYVALVGFYAAGITGVAMCLLGSVMAYLVTARHVHSWLRDSILPPDVESNMVAPEDHPNWSSYRP